MSKISTEIFFSKSSRREIKTKNPEIFIFFYFHLRDISPRLYSTLLNHFHLKTARKFRMSTKKFRKKTEKFQFFLFRFHFPSENRQQIKQQFKFDAMPFIGIANLNKSLLPLRKRRLICFAPEGLAHSQKNHLSSFVFYCLMRTSRPAGQPLAPQAIGL